MSSSHPRRLDQGRLLEMREAVRGGTRVVTPVGAYPSHHANRGVCESSRQSGRIRVVTPVGVYPSRHASRGVSGCHLDVSNQRRSHATASHAPHRQLDREGHPSLLSYLQSSSALTTSA